MLSWLVGLLGIITHSFSVGAVQRENATLLTLCRNSDLYELLQTIQNVEDRFNHQFHYDWVFLNDDDFTDEFRTMVGAMSSGSVKFGKIDGSHWSLPEWIDRDKMQRGMDELKDRVIYGDVESYRHMCRWYSGFYQWHELLLGYKYYWRVEPGVSFSCDVPYDPFAMMRTQGKRYGFAISLFEYRITIPTLFQTVVGFFNDVDQQDIIRQIPEDNLHKFIINDDGSYNLCHYWTNFEVADLDLFRSDAYSRYFQYLDRAGGFFYERWGDAPVRSIFASLMLSKEEVHWFDDLGYSHPPYSQCPVDRTLREHRRCSCDPSTDFTSHAFSCTPLYVHLAEQ